MKRIYSLLSVVAMLVVSAGCDESVERELTAAEIEQQVLDRIEKNVGISYNLFTSLARIHNDSIKRMEAASKSKEEFVARLADQTSTYFKDVVKENIGDFDITMIPTPFAGEAEITLKLATCQEKTANTVAGYSSIVLKEAGDDKHKEWILIESFSQAGESKDLPMETFSLNFAKVEALATIIPGILADPELTDEETMSGIDDILIANDIPPVAIGLLLPAIQKVREAAATGSPEPFNDAMIQWLDETVGLASDHGLDRDIIRRIAATVFLAGLHAIVLPDYEGSNQDVASLSVLHAQYRAAILMTSGEFWDM